MALKPKRHPSLILGMSLQKGQSKAGLLTAGQWVGIVFASLIFTTYVITLQNLGVFSSLSRPEIQPVSGSGHNLGKLRITSDFAHRAFEQYKRQEAEKVKAATVWF